MSHTGSVGAEDDRREDEDVERDLEQGRVPNPLQQPGFQAAPAQREQQQAITIIGAKGAT